MGAQTRQIELVFCFEETESLLKYMDQLRKEIGVATVSSSHFDNSAHASTHAVFHQSCLTGCDICGGAGTVAKELDHNHGVRLRIGCVGYKTAASSGDHSCIGRVSRHFLSHL